jgi:hypothetical protein
LQVSQNGLQVSQKVTGWKNFAEFIYPAFRQWLNE